jgi:predicted esterase
MMKRVCQSECGLTVRLFLAGVLSCLLWPVPGRATQSLPEAAEVVRRIVERAQAVARDEAGAHYVYETRALLDHLDAGGQTVTSEERIYQVTLIAGFPFDRLVRIQGRELSGEELRREQRKEERFRQKFSSVNPSNMVARKEAWLTPQLLERYEFVVKERVALDHRATLVLTFSPKEGPLPEKAIQDRFLNRMAGTVWIDEQDADAARLSVRLSETVSLGWFGLLGSLSQCDLSLERKRMPEGVWVNAEQTLRIQYRKLASTIRVRSTEESSGFQKAAAKRESGIPAPVDLGAALTLNAAFKIEGMAAPRDMEFTARVDGSRQRYVEFLPLDYGSNRPCPLMIFLHGHGSDRWQITKGEQWREIQAVCEVAARHRMILLSPDYRATTSWMGPAAEADLMQILQDQKAQRRISKTFLSGGSMGGTSVLIFTALHRELVDGVVSLNGTANLMEYAGFPEAIAASYGGQKSEKVQEYQKRSPELAPDRFGTIPVAFTAGGKDTLVPPQSVMRLSRTLEKQNPGRVLMLFREDGGHSTPHDDALAALEFVIARASL